MTLRRIVATAAIALTGLAVLPAAAQDGYAGGWTDPGPASQRDGKPLGYLDSNRPLVGQVSHPNGIQSVSIVLVDGGEGSCGANAAPVENGAQGSGQSVSFVFPATFPCNDVYEVRATAHAAASGGIGGSQPPPYAMPLLVAVAIPPQPVDEVEATLTVDGADREVALMWTENSEPDLLGYVVTRVVDGDRDTLGQVDSGEDPFYVDADPPDGATVVYEVTAVREGPDAEVDQVPSAPTTVSVDVPPAPEPDSDDGDDDEGGDGGSGGDGGDGESDGLTSASTATTTVSSSPQPGQLSSVRSRGSAAPRVGPPTTLDTGFGDLLPFEVPEGGDDVAVPPVGDGAVVAEFEFDDADSPLGNRETMALVAGGLALFVGALVIVYVTRRAASMSY